MTLPPGKYFRPEEFACHDAARTPYPVEWLDRWTRLVGLLDAIREAWGSGIYVVSGYRTREWNDHLIAADKARGSHGVASGSQHLAGRAADICPVSGPREAGRLYDVIVKLDDPRLGGLALYPRSGWVHVDTYTENGHLRTWAGS